MTLYCARLNAHERLSYFTQTDYRPDANAQLVKLGERAQYEGKSLVIEIDAGEHPLHTLKMKHVTDKGYVLFRPLGKGLEAWFVNLGHGQQNLRVNKLTITHCLGKQVYDSLLYTLLFEDHPTLSTLHKKSMLALLLDLNCTRRGFQHQLPLTGRQLKVFFNAVMTRVWVNQGGRQEIINLHKIKTLPL